MKLGRHFIILCAMSVCACVMVSCGGRTGKGRVPQPSDTLYTREAAMNIYAYQPERALQIIDSAVIVGNLHEWAADVGRARVYSTTLMWGEVDSLLGGTKDVRLDTAEAICERLLLHDSVLADPKRQQDVLEILTYTERMQNDTVGWLERSRELVEVCHQVGSLATFDGMRTEAEIGAALCAMGQMEEGMAKMDKVISALSDARSFAALDALIIASKRKMVILGSHNRYAETLPVARLIIERLDDYKANPEPYHDGSHREPKTDEKREAYIHFYRTQAESYMTAAYSSLGEEGNMLAAFKQIEQSVREAAKREYFAQYKALQQQIKAEQEKAKADRAHLMVVAISILLLLVVVFSVVVWCKNRFIGRKNRILVQQVSDALKYKELYLNEKQTHEPKKVVTKPNEMSDEELFREINEVIVREKLFLDPKFGRQTLMDRLHLSKERVGTIFSKGSEYATLSNYTQQLRLEYATKLLVENPEMNIMQIAAESGFSSHKYFTDRFRQQFSMTPTEFREAKLLVTDGTTEMV